MSLPTLRAERHVSEISPALDLSVVSAAGLSRSRAQSAVVDLGVFFDGQLRTVADGGNGERQHVTSVAVQR